MKRDLLVLVALALAAGANAQAPNIPELLGLKQTHINEAKGVGKWGETSRLLEAWASVSRNWNSGKLQFGNFRTHPRYLPNHLRMGATRPRTLPNGKIVDGIIVIADKWQKDIGIIFTLEQAQAKGTYSGNLVIDHCVCLDVWAATIYHETWHRFFNRRGRKYGNGGHLEWTVQCHEIMYIECVAETEKYSEPGQRADQWKAIIDNRKMSKANNKARGV